MHEESKIPKFAVLGHPNEGKSSVVSTLAEDDSVKISPYPGETVKCRSFPVIIDGVEMIRFIDTPGFQVPQKTLAWFKKQENDANDIVARFIEENRENDRFRDECELFLPVADGAGIIYTADGSRPLRKNDLIEMEILKRTGLPRIAIINSKTDDHQYAADWKEAFSEHFDSVLFFNAHNAVYLERISLLEKLKDVFTGIGPSIEKVIDAFKLDWSKRNAMTSELLSDMIEDCLTYQVASRCPDKDLIEEEKQLLLKKWINGIEVIEKGTHQKIRKLFKHNIFNIDLPADSILSKDLFDSSTWKLLGLTKGQLTATAATIGGAAAAVIDIALAGHSFGLFALLGSVAGAGSALLGAEKIGKTKVVGKKLGGYELQIGPNKNIQFMYVLMDRALVYYSHIINWAHGKRDYSNKAHLLGEKNTKKEGFTSYFSKETQSVFNTYFKEIVSKDSDNVRNAKREAVSVFKGLLDDIPEDLRSLKD